MQSTLNKPSDFYFSVVAELKSRIKGAEVCEYAMHGDYKVKGLECHVKIDEYGELKQANDQRLTQPVKIVVFCFVSKAINDDEKRSAELIAQDLSSAVGRIAFNNNFGLGKTVGFPKKIISQEGMFKSGADAYECWETEWWQDLKLGTPPADEPLVMNVLLAVNPELANKNDEYVSIEKAISNDGFNTENHSTRA